MACMRPRRRTDGLAVAGRPCKALSTVRDRQPLQTATVLQEETVPFLGTIIRSQTPEPTRASPEYGQLSYPQEGRWSSASA